MIPNKLTDSIQIVRSLVFPKLRELSIVTSNIIHIEYDLIYSNLTFEDKYKYYQFEHYMATDFIVKAQNNTDILFSCRTWDSEFSEDRFYIRFSRTSGQKTEYQKLKEVFKVNENIPHFSLIAFVSKKQQKLWSFAITHTYNIIKMIDQQKYLSTIILRDNPSKESMFYVIEWKKIITNNLDILTYHCDTGLNSLI